MSNNVLKVMVGKKRNQPMYVKFTEDTKPNVGGYYCEVFYNHECTDKYDDFTIENSKLRCVEDKMRSARSIANDRVLNMFGIY